MDESCVADKVVRWKTTVRPITRREFILVRDRELARHASASHVT